MKKVRVMNSSRGRITWMLLPSLAGAFLIFCRILELEKVLLNPCFINQTLSLGHRKWCFHSATGKQSSGLVILPRTLPLLSPPCAALSRSQGFQGRAFFFEVHRVMTLDQHVSYLARRVLIMTSLLF